MSQKEEVSKQSLLEITRWIKKDVDELADQGLSLNEIVGEIIDWWSLSKRSKKRRVMIMEFIKILEEKFGHTETENYHEMMDYLVMLHGDEESDWNEK